MSAIRQIIYILLVTLSLILIPWNIAGGRYGWATWWVVMCVAHARLLWDELYPLRNDKEDEN